jgi:solute:Na+ symporter, SSS family
MGAARVNEYLDSADWLVIFTYLAGIIAFGLWLGRGQRNTRDYFLGSRNIPWWGVGLSIVATETSALTIIGVPALAFAGNLAFIQIVIGYVIARIVLAIWLVPHYFKGEIYSPYELLSNSFGPSARRTAALFFLIAGTLAAGVRVYVTSIPIQLMLDLRILPSILLFLGLSLVYTYVGGIRAVIWTDAVQFALFMAGGIFTVLYVPQLFDGGYAEIFAKASKAGKLDWLNTRFSLGLPLNLWMGLIGGTVQVLFSHGADQLIVQRVLTCKSTGDGRRALILSAVIILPLMLIFLFTGVMLWVYYQQFPMAIPIPETTGGLKKDDYVYPIFILTAVPNIFKGLLIVAILSAAMSSVSSALAALASVSTMDFSRRGELKETSEKGSLRFGRYSTVFWALMLILVAYASKELPSVLYAAFKLNGLTSGALLGGVIFALWARRGRALPVIVGMVVSLVTMIVISRKTSVAWPWFTLIGTLVTLSVAWMARVLSRGPERGS